MILNHRPFKDSLFAPFFSLGNELETLARIGSSHLALFHRDDGILLMGPSLRTIWPEAAPGASLDQFWAFLEDNVAPAERFHLAAVQESLLKIPETASDIFLLKAGRIPDVTLLGLAFIGFPWGTFLVFLPGRNGARVKEVLDHVSSGPMETLRPPLSLWVEEAENEFVLTPLFHNFPEEFLNLSGFLRSTPAPLSDGRQGHIRIAYRFRNRKWHRDSSPGPTRKSPPAPLKAGVPFGKRVYASETKF